MKTITKQIEKELSKPISKRRQIFRMCNDFNNEHNVNLDSGFIADFILSAFDDKVSNAYAYEWIVRFSNGNPISRMDRERTEVYLKLLNDYWN